MMKPVTAKDDMKNEPNMRRLFFCYAVKIITSLSLCLESNLAYNIISCDTKHAVNDRTTISE